MSVNRPDGLAAARAIAALEPQSMTAQRLVTAVNRYYAAVHASNIENEDALHTALDFIRSHAVPIPEELRIHLETVLDDLERCPLCQANCKKDAQAERAVSWPPMDSGTVN